MGHRRRSRGGVAWSFAKQLKVRKLIWFGTVRKQAHAAVVFGCAFTARRRNRLHLGGRIRKRIPHRGQPNFAIIGANIDNCERAFIAII